MITESNFGNSILNLYTVAVMENFLFSSVPFKRNGNITEGQVSVFPFTYYTWYVYI